MARKIDPQQKLKKFYEKFNEELGLEGLTITEQIHKLIDAANETHKLVDEQMREIKEVDYVKAFELTPIDKPTYMEFVRICSLKNNDKLQDKAIDKFVEDFDQRLFTTNIRHSFLESYMNGEDLKITDEDNQEYKPFTDYKSEEFEKIMNESASKREYINLVLNRRIKQLGKAAEFITDGELKFKDFKKLADFEYYKDGGIPKEDSPSKIWKIFQTFNDSYRLMNKYGYTQETYDLKNEFGLDITLHEPNYVAHPWEDSKNDEGE